MFEKLPLADVVRIVEAGGGFTMNGQHRPTDDLIRIADTAARARSSVKLTGLTNRSVDEFCRIAAAGRGAVQFDDA